MNSASRFRRGSSGKWNSSRVRLAKPSGRVSKVAHMRVFLVFLVSPNKGTRLFFDSIPLFTPASGLVFYSTVELVSMSFIPSPG